jgi:hypothetical protein
LVDKLAKRQYNRQHSKQGAEDDFTGIRHIRNDPHSNLYQVHRMKYTLITKQGKVLTFFLKSVADTYQQAYGGVVITQQVLVDTETV